MKKPKTIKEYISLIKMIETIDLQSMKGFDKLSDEEKEPLIIIAAEISNNVSEM